MDATSSNDDQYSYIGAMDSVDFKFDHKVPAACLMPQENVFRVPDNAMNKHDDV